MNNDLSLSPPHPPQLQPPPPPPPQAACARQSSTKAKWSSYRLGWCRAESSRTPRSGQMGKGRDHQFSCFLSGATESCLCSARTREGVLPSPHMDHIWLVCGCASRPQPSVACLPACWLSGFGLGLPELAGGRLAGLQVLPEAVRLLDHLQPASQPARGGQSGTRSG